MSEPTGEVAVRLHQPDVNVDPEAARRTVEQYLRGLESGDFDAVAACFTEDAFYSHPPYEQGQPLAEAVGRNALIELLRARRGSRTWVHEVEPLHIGGDRGLLETTVREYAGGPVRSTSIGVATFAADGRLRRWVAYRSAPPIGSSVGLA